MDFLLDGTITKEEYSSKTKSINAELSELEKKEMLIESSNEENFELFKRLNSVRELFQNKEEKGIEFPIMCSHIEQIKVYENRLDIYLDFLKNTNLLSINYCKNNTNSSYDKPIRVGRRLP